MLKPKTCDHVQDFVPQFKAKAYECAACVQTGDHWVHLRTCQFCGVTLCCDSSPNQHATKHFQSHPAHHLVISAEPGEQWVWCYQDRVFGKYE